MRAVRRVLAIAIIAMGCLTVVTGQGAAVVSEADTWRTTLLKQAGFASLVCLASAMSYVMFGMPRNRRFSNMLGELVGNKAKLRRRRAIEVLVVAIGGGLAGYFLLSPTSGHEAITAGAMWYGTFYRLAHDESKDE